MRNARKIQLIVVAFQGIPIYFLSIFKINQNMVDKLEKKQRNFLLSRIEEKNKLNLVKWDNVYKPKDKGGLGIRCIAKLNKTLLEKVWWRLIENKTRWGLVMSAKYLSNTHFNYNLINNDLLGGSKV